MEGLRPEIPSNSRNSGWILYRNPRKLQIELFSLRIYLRIRKEKKEVHASRGKKHGASLFLSLSLSLIFDVIFV